MAVKLSDLIRINTDQVNLKKAGFTSKEHEFGGQLGKKDLFKF